MHAPRFAGDGAEKKKTAPREESAGLPGHRFTDGDIEIVFISFNVEQQPGPVSADGAENRKPRPKS